MAQRRSLMACLAVLLVGAPAAAQPEAQEAGPAPLDDRYRPQVAAAEVVAAGAPLTMVAMLQRGFQAGIWMGKPAKSALVDTGLLVGVEDRKPLQAPSDNRWEWDSYCNLLLHASETPSSLLAPLARQDVFLPNLIKAPADFRGQPIRIRGRLGRLLKEDAPRRLWQDGLRHVYEGWIYPDENNPYNVYAVFFCEHPKDVQLGEKVNYYVQCDAYFFKILRYEAPDRTDRNKKVRRDAPMFIARDFQLAQPPPPEEFSTPFTGTLIPGVLIGILSLLGLFVAITWFFRRGDRQVQSRIRDARQSEFVPPPADTPRNGPAPTEEPRETFS